MTLMLRTFGALELVTATGERVPGAGVQPKPLLILALAALTPGGMSRDRLARALWPGVTRERARATLKQHLYALRRATGLGDLVGGAQRIVVPPDLLRVDAIEFSALVDAGRLADAARLLRGELLEEVDAQGRAGIELARVVTELRAQWTNRVALVRTYMGDALTIGGDQDLPAVGGRAASADRDLRAASRRFVRGLLTLPEDPSSAVHRTTACLHDLLEATLAGEAAGLSPEVLREALADATALWGRSDLVAALQRCEPGTAPPAHFFEWLMAGVPRTRDPIGRVLERVLLRSPLAAQVHAAASWQMRHAQETLGGAQAPCRLLLLGSALTLPLAPLLAALESRVASVVVLADPEGEAVTHHRLDTLGDRVQALPADLILEYPLVQAAGPYDLILGGGALDGMDRRTIAWAVPHLAQLLAPGGELLLTLPATGSSAVAWQRHLAGWPVEALTRDDAVSLSRSEHPFHQLCHAAVGEGEWWLTLARQDDPLP